MSKPPWTFEGTTNGVVARRRGLRAAIRVSGTPRAPVVHVRVMANAGPAPTNAAAHELAAHIFGQIPRTRSPRPASGARPTRRGADLP